MKIHIQEFFEQCKQEQQQTAAKALAERESNNKKIGLLTEELSTLQVDIRKKKHLLKQNEDEGLEIEKLKAKIQELNSKAAQITSQIDAEKQSAKQQSTEITNRSFAREDLMATVLKDCYKCSEAVVAGGVEECFEKFAVTINKVDENGHPISCKIKGAQQSAELTIMPNDKYWKTSFRPDGLQWLPDITGLTTNTKEKGNKTAEDDTLVFFDKKTNKLVLSKKLNWSQEIKQSRYPYEHETKRYEDDFSDIAISLKAQLDALVLAENNTVDLDKSYESNPLFTHVSFEIKKQTCSKPAFIPSSEQLQSGEIYHRIKQDWDAFATSPWSEDVFGVLALLKYHIENGERARFWSGDFKNQYGLRLRTRDHDWIKANLFINESENPTDAKMTIEVYDANANAAIARIGRLFLSVSRAN